MRASGLVLCTWRERRTAQVAMVFVLASVGLVACGSAATSAKRLDVGREFLTAMLVTRSERDALAVSDRSLRASIRASLSEYRDAGFRPTGVIEPGSCASVFAANGRTECVSVRVRGCPRVLADHSLFVRFGRIAARISSDQPPRVVSFSFQGGGAYTVPGTDGFERMLRERRRCTAPFR